MRLTYVVAITILLGFVATANGAVKFTNFKCECIDKDFCHFDYCYIKAINRTYSYISSKVSMFQIPVYNATIRFDISKRASGYRPFLYNMTFDACKFLRSTNSNKVVKFFYEILKPYSNLNHTCPYNHDLIVDRLPIHQVNHRFTDVLPFPLGDYRIESHWLVSGIQRSYWNTYFSLT